MKKIISLWSLFFLLHSLSFGEAIATKDVSYEIEGKSYTSYIANLANREKLPGIILIHHYKGLDQATKDRTELYAKEGFVVLAMDMYGSGVRPTSHEEAGKMSGYYRENRDEMRKNIHAAVELLKSNSSVDKDNIGVVGYCFGGDALIDYMLYKDDFKAGASFHGFYTSPLIENKLNGALEIHHGKLDTSSTMEDLEKFTKIHPETRVFIYDEGKHSFAMPGSNYNEGIDKKSFIESVKFLKNNLK